MGNTLSVMVFSSKEMLGSSSNVYLLLLAVSDSAYLLCVLMTKILSTFRCLYFVESTVDVFNRSVILCKALQYLLDVFSDYSTCLILSFTVERFIAVYRPIRFKELCTVQRARVACLVELAVIAMVIAPYHMMYMGIYDTYASCVVLMEHEMEFVISYVVEVATFRIIPVLIIACLNVFIIIKVTKLTRERRKLRALATRNMKSAQADKDRKKASARDDKSTQLTIMLILVSSSYIVLYMPVLVHFVMWKLKRSNVINPSHAALGIAQNYARALYVSCFAINFFLYTMSGSVFREQLVKILSSSRRSREHHYNGTLTTKPDENSTLL